MSRFPQPDNCIVVPTSMILAKKVKSFENTKEKHSDVLYRIKLYNMHKNGQEAKMIIYIAFNLNNLKCREIKSPIFGLKAIFQYL